MMSLGTDFNCAEDITTDWAVEENPRAALLQALFRRLVHVPGSTTILPSDYGAGVLQFNLDSGLTLPQIKSIIVGQLLKDERVRDVQVFGDARNLKVQVTPHDDPEFSGTLTIDLVSGFLGIDEA